jgi:outer membrane protein assembly factor BamB
MFRPHRAGVLVAGAFLLVAGELSAGGTRSFRQTAAKDFEEGEATASTILPSGEVAPGMKATRIGLEAAFVWCAVLSPDGRTAYLGTGDQGAVYAVTLRQGSTAPTVRKLAELDAPWVTSLALRPDGTLLAGTTPGGRIFAIDPRKTDKNAGARPFAKLAAEHVWALAYDAKSGVTYAGTGGGGKIFAIDAKGGVRLHWDSGDKHIVSLLALGGGRLLAGTSEEAILYRVNADGKAEALHDFEAEEVRAIARAGDMTYVAVNDFEKGSSEGTATGGPVAAKGTKITLGSSTTAPASAGALPRPTQVKAKSAVYRLADDGSIEQIFALPEGYLSSLLAEPPAAGEHGLGSVYAAAGTQGKVYQILPNGTFALAADLSERQALALVRVGHGFLVGTGDVGGLYEVRPAGPGEASYLSKVFDSEFFASWGRMRWSGSPNLAFETRSGNTGKPDATWSGWKKLESVLFEAGEGEGRVASPGARYLQYRVSLPDNGGSLKEITLFYLPQNQRARVTEVTLADPGAKEGTTRSHSPVLKLRWKVENPDGDELSYRLAYRPQNESVWRPLGGPEPLAKPEYDWSTDSVPDGRYVVRVTASDDRSTPRERALESSFVSPPFLVDNTRPDLLELAGRAPTVSGRARDAASVVSQIEYSVDGGDWRPATPSDGVLDQRSEGLRSRPAWAKARTW